ncbi:MAG: Ig-like domain-containing protein, partial [Bacteroidales bacterium]|nr:Ig-like domain-containing protein [Bacteroidales bacterium]
DLPFQSEVPTLGASGETTWQMLWTDDGLFLLLVVTDDEFYPNYAVDPVGASYEYDKPEIYFDCNYDLVDGGGASAGESSGHHQVAPSFTDGSNDGTVMDAAVEDAEDVGVIYAFTVTEPNYTAEYFFPWTYLDDRDGGLVAQDATIGFDVTIIDRDEGDAARKRAVWANNEVDESWNTMDDAGLITLEGAEAKTYIESITVTGGTIDVNNGTFQMEYTILPEDATSQRLSWSVENGTGRAKVNSDGVVTAVTDGEVTVTGKTTDGSYLDESATITISNQIVVMDEINLVRNGNFNDLNENAFPLEWNGGNSDDADGYVTEGYMVLDPVVGGVYSYDFTFTQQGFGCNTTDMYTFSFVAWADAIRTCNVDFEDSSNGYNRYGTTTHEYSADGQSDWTFDLTTDPTKYVFDVVFNEKLENTNESLQFMLGLSDTIVYLDSVMLINELDLVLLTDYTPVSSVDISAADDVTFIEVGNTVQMSAAVLPAEADYPDIVWSVVNKTGYATIDEAGLVSGDTIGLVTIMASTTDDSNVSSSFDLEIRIAGAVSDKTIQSLRVYPNPAVNELNIVLGNEEATVSIYNSVGMRMNEFIANEDILTIDISSYASGVYFVKTGNMVTKFVK